MSELDRAANPTIEEAIKYLEGMIFTQDFHPSTLRAKAVNTMAIAALREQAERSKGCDYCLSTWPDRAADGFSDIWHKNKLSVGYGVYREIKFCPMCGRRLEATHA